jgi:hypothetical protein
MGDSGAGAAIGWGGWCAWAGGASLLLFFTPVLLGAGPTGFLLNLIAATANVFSLIFVPAPLVWLYRRRGAPEGRGATLAASVLALILSNVALPAAGGGLSYLY